MTTEQRLQCSAAILAGTFFAQLVGVVLSGSQGLLADTAHVTVDITAQLVSLFVGSGGLRRESGRRWPLGREVADLINGLLLWAVVALVIVPKAAARFIWGHGEIGFVYLALFASVGLLANLVAMRVLGKDPTTASAGAHLKGDALVSVGVIVTGILMLITGWRVVDTGVSLVIAGYIVWIGKPFILENIPVLAQAIPEDIDMSEVEQELRAIQGIRDVHGLNIYRRGLHTLTSSAHLIAEKDWQESLIRAHAESVYHRFGLHGSTQVEYERAACCP